MVQVSGLKPHEITKTRLNQGNMEIGGLLKKTSIFSRIKRRFSQSEQDISTLNLEESYRNPRKNPKTISSIDDSLVDCKIIKRKTNKSLSNGEIDDFQPVEAYKCGPPEYLNKNRSINRSREFFNHKNKDLRCYAGLKSYEQFEKDRQFRKEHVCNHYVDATEMMESLKARKAADGSRMETVIESKAVDYNRNKIMISLEKTENDYSFQSQSAKVQAKSDSLATTFSKLKFDKGHNRKEIVSGKMVESGDLARGNQGTSCESATEEVFKRNEGCESILPHGIKCSDNVSLKNSDHTTENETRIPNQIYVNVIENIQLNDNVSAKTSNKLKTKSDSPCDENPKKNSETGVENQGNSIVPLVRGKTALSCENLSQNGSYSEVRSSTSNFRARRLSAPSLSQILSEEHAHLDDIFKKGSKERSNSLKSALKRRAVSDTTGSSLRVRFDLRETTSSDEINSKATSAEEKDSEEIKSTNATNAPKKRWKYVMRKFRINKDVNDFGSCPDEKIEKRANGDCNKTEAKKQQRKISEESMSVEFAKEIGSQEEHVGKEEGRREEDGETTKKQSVVLKTRPSSPSWSEMAPGTEKDGSSVPLLHLAAADGDTEMIKTLINIGVDLNERDSNGWPPIHYAIARGHFECAALLIENGVNLNCYTNDVIEEYCRTVRAVMIKKDR